MNKISLFAAAVAVSAFVAAPVLARNGPGLGAGGPNPPSHGGVGRGAGGPNPPNHGGIGVTGPGNPGYGGPGGRYGINPPGKRVEPPNKDKPNPGHGSVRPM